MNVVMCGCVRVRMYACMRVRVRMYACMRVCVCTCVHVQTNNPTNGDAREQRHKGVIMSNGSNFTRFSLIIEEEQRLVATHSLTHSLTWMDGWMMNRRSCELIAPKQSREKKDRRTHSLTHALTHSPTRLD
eukprot:GHVU01040673.1.p1 GENE.GHVU01040673.1~~GHVU01040673.1.p1  ORF type:complete len:131 (-),score=4.87 GHVU01040673.1:393-785(-)